MKKHILMCWSGGKDCAMALRELLADDAFEVVSLFTTLTEDYGRISMHGVREALLDEQARSIGLPLEKMMIPKDASNEVYESRMWEMLERHRASGISGVAFGDLYLEGIREYREKNMAQVNMEAVFPIWQRDARELAGQFIDDGFRAVITCVDTEAIDGGFTGREFDRRFLADLPAGADPCGEKGEFHSFVYNGPIFDYPVPFTKGDIVLRDNRFAYCDLIPKTVQ